MKLLLDRNRVELPNETVGVLFIDGIPRFVTLENKHTLIPAGTYKAVKDTHYGLPGDQDNYIVWELQNVPGFTQVQIHIGNHWRNSRGCQLIGKQFSLDSQYPYISLSGVAFEEFMEITSGETELEITIQ